MAHDDTITDAIATNATGPRRVRTDDLDVEARSLRELIEADQYLTHKESGARGPFAIRFTKMLPPGTVYDNGST